MYKGNKYILNYEFSYKGLVSTNEAYFHMPKKSKKSNRMTTYTVKSDKLKELQKDVGIILSNLIPEDYVKIISDLVDTKFYGLKVVTIYSMPYETYRDGDVSNYIKNYEDCIATRLREFNKNLDDRNNLEYRAIKKYNSNSQDWKIRTIIYPIERDINYRSEILQLYCPECQTYRHCNVNILSLNCCSCNTAIGIHLNTHKFLYGITKSNSETICSVCGSPINEDGVCSYCGIDKQQYDELLNEFNEEEFV